MEKQNANLDEVVMTLFVVPYQNSTNMEWPDAWTIDDEGWLLLTGPINFSLEPWISPEIQDQIFM